MNTPEQAAAQRRGSAKSAAVRRAATHCKRGHPFSGDNLIIREEGKRKCRACQNMHVKISHSRMPTPERIDNIMTALRSGTTKDGLTRGRKVVAWPSMQTFLSSGHEDVKTALALIERNRIVARDRSLVVAIPSVRVNRWISTFAVEAINSVVPRNIPDFVRDEIRNELLSKLWTGESAPSQLRQASKSSITRFYGDYDLMSRYGKHRSIDATFDGGLSTLHDFANGNIWEMGR